MKKRNKNILIVGSFFALLLCIGILWFQFPEWSFVNSDTEKVFCKAKLDDEFSADEVVIVLTNEASLESIDHDYTTADFPGIGCVEVDDLSSATTEHIRKQLRGEKIETSDRPGASWFAEPKDTTKFRRTLYLKLDKESKINVLFVIKMLEHRNDIYAAEPNYIFHITD